MDRETARSFIKQRYLNGGYANTPMRISDALQVVSDIFNKAKCIEAREVNDDADIKVLNWELVGKKVFIIVNGKIVDRTLNKILVSKDSSGLTVQTSILYRCDADMREVVYATKETCAEAWLEEQGITAGLKDIHE